MRFLEVTFSYLSDLKESINRNDTSIHNTQKGLEGTKNNIDSFEKNKTNANNQITQIKVKITSIKPTITSINKVLKSFGFESFELAENTSQEGTYKIIRPSDKSDVQDTLSEGEANFICVDKLQGSDKLIGKSLISLINDGSHSIFDDYTARLSTDDVEPYYSVFKQNFSEMGQIEHYNMMMGINVT